MDRSILSKLDLANKAVKAYLRTNPRLGYLKDDLKSAAVLGLVLAIRQLPENVRSVDAYLMRCVQRAIAEATANEDAIHVPLRTRQWAKQNGRTVGSIASSPLPHELVDRGGPYRGGSRQIEDEADRELVNLRSEGYTLAEIGIRMGLDFRRVSEILQRVVEQYDFDVAISDERPKRTGGTSTVCGCGQPVKFTNETRCPDCWALDQQHYHGRSQSVNLAKNHHAPAVALVGFSGAGRSSRRQSAA